MIRLAFVTWSGLRDLAEDDRLAVAELRVRGASVEAVAWDDAGVAWEAFDGVILRSCWDYHLRVREFSDWLSRMDRARVRLFNPVPLLHWNMDKTYLRSLQADGVRVVPTRWVSLGERAELGAILSAEGWGTAVVKPTISASAHQTWRTSNPPPAEDVDRFRSESARGPLMVQPFVEQVVTEGEWSLCFLGGAYSHAVRKAPAAGEFRVQPEHGGRIVAANPPSGILRAATAVLDRVARPWLYARVDGCVVDGDLWLMELELLEPSLFLDRAAGAPARFADAVLEAVRPRECPARRRGQPAPDAGPRVPARPGHPPTSPPRSPVSSDAESMDSTS